MRLSSLIRLQNFLGILLLCIYCINSCECKQPKDAYNDEGIRVITTNYSPDANCPPIVTNAPSYYEFICKSQLFVDNSMLLRYVATHSSSVIVLPRRFGKSLNFLMTKCFYEIPVYCVGNACEHVPKNMTEAYQIFKNGLLTNCPHMDIVKLHSSFKIASSSFVMRQMNQHPVILINFQAMSPIPHDIVEIYDFITCRIRQLYDSHFYLTNTKGEIFKPMYNELLYPTSRDLSYQKNLIMKATQAIISMIRNYFGKNVILLVDEYDSVMNTVFLNTRSISNKCKDDILGFFGTFYGTLLKDNPFIQKALLTGIISWKNSNIVSTLLQISTLTITDHFPMNSYGFSENDVHEMYTYINNHLKKLPHPESVLKGFYDGYLFGDANIKRFNPISVVSYFKDEKLDWYWGETGDARYVLCQLMKFYNFNKDFMGLLAPDGTYVMDLAKCLPTLSLQSMQAISSAIHLAVLLPASEWYCTLNSLSYLGFSLLFATGYLTQHESSNSTHLILKIPNEEVRSVLWESYHNILANVNKESRIKKQEYRRSIESFAPFLGEIVKTEETNCNNLVQYFYLSLIELPTFTKKPLKQEYYYASEAQIESTLVGVLEWFHDEISVEEQHGFREKQGRDKKAVGRPDVAVLSSDKTLLTVFEIGLDKKFENAYIQGIKYTHVYFLNSDYNSIEKIKIIPFVVNMDKTVYANATICSRKDYFRIANLNDFIETLVRSTLRCLPNETSTASIMCRKTCNNVLAWSEWNVFAKDHEFDHYEMMFTTNCRTWLPKDQPYSFRSSSSSKTDKHH